MVLAQYALEKRIEKPNDRAAGKRKITNSGASATYDNAQPHLRWSRIHKGGSMAHVWVIERQYEEGWFPMYRNSYSTRLIARSHLDFLHSEFNVPKRDLRVQKYIRAE